MALADDAALRNLSQFVNIMTSQGLQQSPEKLAALDDIMQNVVNTIPQFTGMPELTAQTDSASSKPTASSSSGSASPRDETMEDPESNSSETSAPATTNAVARQYRLEPWHECFTTTKKAEFEALIYSVYVIQRDDRKLDGYDYFECINRLQSKCRYKVRTKKVNEFFIVEEKGAHNHAMEPVGSPGSHAGLPKTLREIVDSSFHNDWPNTVRQQKIEEEVKRLGLPHNPRLGRQIDNRIAYLRRVKNLTEMRKLQDQLPVSAPSALPPQNGIAPPNGGSPDEILRLMMQMHQDSAPPTDTTPSPPQLAPMAPVLTTPLDSVNSEMIAPPPPQLQQPVLLTQQSPLVIHDGNNELMKMLLQAKDGMQDQSQILQMLAPFLPPQALQQQPQDSSRSTPEGRLNIDDQ